MLSTSVTSVKSPLNHISLGISSAHATSLINYVDSDACEWVMPFHAPVKRGHAGTDAWGGSADGRSRHLAFISPTKYADPQRHSSFGWKVQSAIAAGPALRQTLRCLVTFSPSVMSLILPFLSPTSMTAQHEFLGTVRASGSDPVDLKCLTLHWIFWFICWLFVSLQFWLLVL